MHWHRLLGTYDRKESKLVPTREEFIAIVEKACRAGHAAAQQKYDELAAAARPGQQILDVAGGASLILKVDGRSQLGKFLDNLIREPLPNVGVWKNASGRYGIPVANMHSYWSPTISEAAERAALRVFEEHLGVKGYIKSYLD